MPRWSRDDLARFLERAQRTRPIPGGFDCHRDEPEASLHDFILEETGRRGWLAFHGSMAHRTRRQAGEPDFEILTPGGRLLLIEVKSAQGKLRPEQLALAAHAKKLGHTVHVVRTQREFLQLVSRHEHENQSQEGLHPGT